MYVSWIIRFERRWGKRNRKKKVYVVSSIWNWSFPLDMRSDIEKGLFSLSLSLSLLIRGWTPFGVCRSTERERISAQLSRNESNRYSCVSHCLRTRRQSGLMDLFVIWFSWWCSFVYFLPWRHDECTSRTNNERKNSEERRVRANGIAVSLSSFIRYSLSSILVVIID